MKSRLIKIRITLIFAILSGCIYMSCKSPSWDETFREQLDRIKKEEPSILNASVTTSDVDSSRHWDVLTEINQAHSSTEDAIIIHTLKTEFRQKDSLIQTVNNELHQEMKYQGQVIMVDLPDKATLCYWLTNKQNASTIFRITCKLNGKSSIEKVDSATSAQWAEIKASILRKHS